MKKKMLSIILTGLIVLSLVACGKDDNNSITSDKQEEKQEPFSEAVENHKLWVAVYGTPAKDSHVRQVYYFDNNTITLYSHNGESLELGELQGLSDEEILTEVKSYNYEERESSSSYSFMLATDDTGNTPISETLYIDGKEDIFCNEMTPTSKFTIYDETYQGFWEGGGEYDETFITKVESDSPLFTFDTIGTDGVEVE